MSKLSLHSTSGTLGHLGRLWPGLSPFAGSWMPCGLPSRRCSSSRRIYNLDSIAGDWSHSSSGNSKFLSRFVAASSSFHLGSSPGVAGSKFWTWYCSACLVGYCHCSPARRLHARTSSHSAQQLVKLRATWQETSFAPICVVHHVKRGRSGAVLCPQLRLGIAAGSGERQWYSQAHCHAACTTPMHP